MKESGFTLVEVVVAILVSALMVTSFFSVALTSRMQSGRGDRKAAAMQQARRVLEKLRNYVIEPTEYDHLPNGGALPGDINACSIPAGMTQAWALQSGSDCKHNVTSFLDNDPNFAGTSATMFYTVSDGGSGSCSLLPGGKCVSIEVAWTEQGI